MPRLPAVFASLIASGIAMAASPATAQDKNVKINQIYIAKGEQCPASTEEVITVCGILEDPYRIPRALRSSGDPANEAWGERAQTFQMVGEFGALSCSPAGQGGAFGCTQKMIEQAYAEKENAPATRFSELIEEERQKRLAEIDADAADEQARVEMIEREYEARLAAERDTPVDGEEAEGPPPVGMLPPDRRVPLNPDAEASDAEAQPRDTPASIEIGIE